MEDIECACNTADGELHKRTILCQTEELAQTFAAGVMYTNSAIGLIRVSPEGDQWAAVFEDEDISDDEGCQVEHLSDVIESARELGRVQP